MNLAEAKEAVEAVEPRLDAAVFVVAHTFERDGRKLHLALTGRLRKLAKRGRVWKSKAFLTALKNAEYGFDPKLARSERGQDGVFLLDRSHAPKNEMMKKIFDHYLDRPGSGAHEVAEALDTTVETLCPVRLVSHHMRLLGVLKRDVEEDSLVLVDYDDTK